MDEPTTRFRHRPDLLPGAVVSAVAYVSEHNPPGIHRGLPSPWLTFLVSVDGPVRVLGTVDAPATPAAYDVMVAGLHPVAARVEQPVHQAGVQLAVHPLAAPALFGCRADELQLGDHGRDVLGPAATALHERVAAVATAEERLDVVQQWARARVGRRRRPGVRPEVAAAWCLLEGSRGRMPVEQVAREVALSTRQLRVVVHREVGLSPKQLARAFRFDAVVAALADGNATLAEVAAATGYADQAHLARDFRSMTGTTPTAWLAEERRNLQDGGHRNRPD